MSHRARRTLRRFLHLRRAQNQHRRKQRAQNLLRSHQLKKKRARPQSQNRGQKVPAAEAVRIQGHMTISNNVPYRSSSRGATSKRQCTEPSLSCGACLCTEGNQLQSSSAVRRWELSQNFDQATDTSPRGLAPMPAYDCCMTLAGLPAPLHIITKGLRLLAPSARKWRYLQCMSFERRFYTSIASDGIPLDLERSEIES